MTVDRAQQAADAIAALGSATPAQAKRTLREFNIDDLIAALATAGGGNGSGSGPLSATKATFGFADFADQGGDLGRSPVAYSLAAGDQLLWVTLRITESFDDSLSPTFYVSTVASGPFGVLVGPLENVGPAATTATDGLVPVFNDTSAANGWDQQQQGGPVEAEAPPLDFHVFGTAMEFDGAAGTIEATFYAATPEAA